MLRRWKKARSQEAPDLPAFRYHPDPIATGSISQSDAACRRCRKKRGFIYTGPAYAEEELDEELCPWCIADGSAAATFDAEFTDTGLGIAEEVPPEALVQLATRTPGFNGWQQEHWLYHCGDAAAFLGRAGYTELRNHEDALDALRQEHAELGWSAGEIESALTTLDSEGDTTAYLFRCLHCGAHLAYSDMS